MTGRNIGIIAGLAAACVGVALVFSSQSGGTAGDDKSGASEKSGTVTNRNNNVSRQQNGRNRKVRRVKPAPNPYVMATNQFETVMRTVEFTAEQRQLLDDILGALRQENRSEVVKLLRKLQNLEEWPDGVPDTLKRAALSALRWVGGGSCLPELIGFLGDKNKEIVSEAYSIWEDAISECDHDVDKTVNGQLEEGIGTHVKNAARVVTDPEVMDSVLTEINSSMRHSVAVDAIKEIMLSGNETAIAGLPEVIENLTGRTDITTPEQLDAWLAENPDDSDDGFMYGGEDDDPEEG